MVIIVDDESRENEGDLGFWPIGFWTIWTVGVTTLCKIIPDGCFEYRTDLEVTDTGVTVCETVWTGWFDPAWTGFISLLVGCWCCTRWIGWLVTAATGGAVVTITEVDPFRVGFSSVLFDGAGGSVSGGGAWALFYIM
jgi:hypothetical protein